MGVSSPGSFKSFTQPLSLRHDRKLLEFSSLDLTLWPNPRWLGVKFFRNVAEKLSEQACQKRRHAAQPMLCYLRKTWEGDVQTPCPLPSPHQGERRFGISRILFPAQVEPSRVLSGAKFPFIAQQSIYLVFMFKMISNWQIHTRRKRVPECYSTRYHISYKGRQKFNFSHFA